MQDFDKRKTCKALINKENPENSRFSGFVLSGDPYGNRTRDIDAITVENTGFQNPVKNFLLFFSFIEEVIKRVRGAFFGFGKLDVFLVHGLHIRPAALAHRFALAET